MDREFEAVKEHLPLVEMNTTAAREHVPDIETGIRRVKEKVRAFSSKWTYLYVPTLLLIHTVYRHLLPELFHDGFGQLWLRTPYLF